MILFISFSHSQKIIKGKITNEKNEIIENASITLESLVDQSVIEFSISDENGTYKIETSEKDLKFKLVVTALNFEKKDFEIDNKSQIINFVLKEQFTQLEEVKIEIKAIQQKNDTLTYDVKFFEGKEDRTLSDILKKIPGIEVEKSGQIKYQGRAINKFYVEGKDLMAGSYGTLTNSMPKDAVSKLQVLENHQPIKRLKNYVPSDRAAINVKLKKDITLTGTGDVGIGATPFLWNAKVTPMMFTKKYQYLFNYKSNNVGEDVTQELQVFSFDEGFEGLILDNQTGFSIGISEPQLPKIEQNRYLFNKTQLFSANLLTSLSKDWELKANANFFNNQINRVGSQQSKVILFDVNGNIENTINFNRINVTDLNNNQLRTQAIVTKNTDKSFLKNTFTFQGNFNKTLGNTLLNTVNVDENLNSPGFSFQNSFSSIFLIGKKIVNFKSIFNYIEDKQKYEVTPYSSSTIPQFPIANIDVTEQNLFAKTINSSNEASFFFSIKKLSIFPTIGFELEHKNLHSSINGKNSNSQIDFGSNFRNNVIWNKFIPTASFSVNYIGESFVLSSNFPVKFNAIHAVDENNSFDKKLNKITVEPHFSLKYKYNTELSKTVYGSINNDFGTINNLYPSYIFSALNITNQNSDIQQSINKKIGGNIEYKLILYNLFMNLNYEYNENDSNVTSSQNVLTNGQTVFEQSTSENKSINKFINYEISKFIPMIKSKFTFAAGFNRSSNELIINDNFISVSTSGKTFNFKINNNYFTWLTFDYSISYFSNKRDNASETTFFKSNLITSFYPKENHSISIFRDDFIYNFEQQNFKNQFIDLSYQYTFEKSKIDLGLKWTNILNTKIYEEFILNNFGYTFNTFNLRPSQFLVSAKFNF